MSVYHLHFFFFFLIVALFESVFPISYHNDTSGEGFPSLKITKNVLLLVFL